MTAIRKIAVIGAGAAGRAFALRAANAGFDVVIEDVMPAKLRRAQDEYAEMQAGDGTLAFALTVEEAVREADLAIDFVPDELESKLEIYSLLDRMAPPHTIFCTPTDTLSMTDLASCTYRAAQCIGIRGDAMAAEVQLIRSRFLTDDVADLVRAFFRGMGSQARMVEDREEPMLVKNLTPEP